MSAGRHKLLIAIYAAKSYMLHLVIAVGTNMHINSPATRLSKFAQVVTCRMFGDKLTPMLTYFQLDHREQP